MKGQFVARTYVPIVTLNEVARRAGMKPNHLSSWWRLARKCKLLVPDLPRAEFVPAVLEPTPASLEEDVKPLTAAEIIQGGTKIRLEVSVSRTGLPVSCAPLSVDHDIPLKPVAYPGGG